MTRHASSGREFVGKLKTEAWFNFKVQIKMKEKIEELLYVYISALDLDRENFDPVLCCDHGCEKRTELNHLHNLRGFLHSMSPSMKTHLRHVMSRGSAAQPAERRVPVRRQVLQDGRKLGLGRHFWVMEKH